MATFFKTDLSEGYGNALCKGFEFMGDAARIRSTDRVAIKPNLTFPTFQRGVMTNPEAIGALVAHLKQYTDKITICESDSGGYNRFGMGEVFQVTGIADIAKYYGVKLVNLSFERSRNITVETPTRQLSVPLPLLLLDETDRFITMPVPKVHANTIISVAIKNQWGVIQVPAERLKLHPFFKRVIYAVNKALPPSLVVVDGRFGLTRNGPMRGDAVELNWLAMCDDIFVNDVMIAKIMGFNPWKIPYIRYALRKEGVREGDTHRSNADLEPHPDPFYLSRAWTDYPGLMTFNSRVLAYIGYESLLAKSLHQLLYLFREPFY
jgi:uncharacterized protein (DUF362 family)